MDQIYNILLVLLIFVSSVILAFGLYEVLMDYIDISSPKARKAVLAMKRSKTTMTESLTIPMAGFITKYIHLDAERKSTLQKKLYSAEIHYTPEFYTAKAIAESILIAAFGLPLYLLHPMLTLVCVVLGVSVYFKNIQELDEIIKKKTEKIDGELVLFASTIKQQLVGSRDVMKILQSYRKICGAEFTHELDMTIADMKTGNYETALRNLESRIPSVGLSEIIRGLLAVMRGDDQRSYFEMLTHDLSVKSKEELKRKALKRPEKLKPVTVLLLGSFLAMYLYVIIYMVATQLTEMF